LILNGKELTDFDIVELAWHWIVEDGLDWDFVAGILIQDYNVDRSLISAEELEAAFMRYFKRSGDVELYTTCPECGKGNLLPRKSEYGYFVGCSSFPKCRYTVKLDRKIK
jgi:hypothetical protein